MLRAGARPRATSGAVGRGAAVTMGSQPICLEEVQRHIAEGRKGRRRVPQMFEGDVSGDHDGTESRDSRSHGGGQW